MIVRCHNGTRSLKQLLGENRNSISAFSDKKVLVLPARHLGWSCKCDYIKEKKKHFQLGKWGSQHHDSGIPASQAEIFHEIAKLSFCGFNRCAEIPGK